MRPFIERYPLFLRGSPEFRDLQQALEPELMELWEARDSALEQLCVETADWGLRYWEQTLGIAADAGEDLDIRRDRVRMKLLGSDVTTVALVKYAVEVYTGLPAEVVEIPERFLVMLSFSLEGSPPKDMEGLTASLLEIFPAHLGLGFSFMLEMPGAPLYITPVLGRGNSVTKLPVLEPGMPPMTVRATPILWRGVSVTALPFLQP